MTLPFVKMEGIGNDFVVLDGIGTPLPILDWAATSRLLNDRRRGVGGDGILLAERGTNAPFRMRMFNPDGSEAEMCGNGIRCLALFLRDAGYLTDDVADVETGAGRLSLHLSEAGVRVDLGVAELRPAQIPVRAEGETFISQPVGEGLFGTAVSMGNPHLVIFTDNVAAVDLEHVGPRLETDPLFPARINVHFVQVLSRTELRMRTWERGAGITLACGTGACAVGVAAFLNGLAERESLVHLPGGDLRIDYQESGRVYMTGPARTVFAGEIEL
ncbi:MAG: diaminopimelate epimerase [Armatimonadota bacterium]